MLNPSMKKKISLNFSWLLKMNKLNFRKKSKLFMCFLLMETRVIMWKMNIFFLLYCFDASLHRQSNQSILFLKCHTHTYTYTYTSHIHMYLHITHIHRATHTHTRTHTHTHAHRRAHAKCTRAYYAYHTQTRIHTKYESPTNNHCKDSSLIAFGMNDGIP